MSHEDHTYKLPENKEERQTFTCNDCEEKFYSRSAIVNHVKTHQKSAKTSLLIICQDCEETKSFSTKSKYIYHLNSQHPGKIRYVCEICASIFKFRANYKSHMQTHDVSNRKRFKCYVCRGTFVHRYSYEAHLKRFPGPHMKFSCQHCGFSFSKEQLLKNHRCKVLLKEVGEVNVSAKEGVFLKEEQQIRNREKVEKEKKKEKKKNEQVFRVSLPPQTLQQCNVLPAAAVVANPSTEQTQQVNTVLGPLYQVVTDWAIVFK